MYLDAKTISSLIHNETATGKLVQAQKDGGKWVTSNFAVIEAIAELAAGTELEVQALEKQVSDYLYTYYVDVRDLPSVSKLAPVVIQATEQGINLNDSLHQACAAYYEVEIFDLESAPELLEESVVEQAADEVATDEAFFEDAAPEQTESTAPDTDSTEAVEHEQQSVEHPSNSAVDETTSVENIAESDQNKSN